MSRETFIRTQPDHFAAITNSDFLYQKAPCGFISFLPDGSILRVNETFCSWMGKTESQVYALKFNELLTRGGSLYYQMVIAPALNIRGAASEISLSFLTDTGTVHTLFNGISYVDSAGKMIAVNATLQNITERKKYEADLLLARQYAEEEKKRFEFLSNTVPNLIWTAVPDGEVDYVNQRIKDHIIPSAENSLMDQLAVVPEDRSCFSAAWQACLESGRRLEREIRLQTRHKGAEWFVVHAEACYNDQGEIISWFGSATNIHKRKLLQLANYSALSHGLSLAHQAIDDHKERLVKIALDQSHMIRRPMANMIGLIALLKDMYTNEEGRVLLEMLESSAEELDQLIRTVVSSSSQTI